jgi:cyclomaltodextrinase
MSVPYWVEDAIFYQIFPDRFANGDSNNDPANVLSWSAIPTRNSFHGGDLRGIIQHFDYLLDLGINALYLNPIFHATSNHRYNTSDYFKIDPKLGDLRDFKAMIDIAHQNGVRIILDGVFNHCGRGFFAFQDVLENQEQSAYKDWFHISNFPVDAYSTGDAKDFLGWWKYKSLPKFNTQYPAVRKYLLEVARYWIDLGADGWRLDVPNEIDDDGFWMEFGRSVKSSNPDAYILGEIWEVWQRWVEDGHCDGLMNYPLREAVLGWLTGRYSVVTFAERVEKLLTVYPRKNVYAMYTTLGSHDTERLLTILGGDIRRMQLALAFLFAYPGAPAVYYGDEIGSEGGKDPDCRRTFPWDPKVWKQDLRDWVKTLVSLRKRYSCLRRGDYQRVGVEDIRGCYAFTRTLGDEQILVVVNSSSVKRNWHLKLNGVGWKDGRIVRDLLGSEEIIVSGDILALTIPPSTAMWLM